MALVPCPDCGTEISDLAPTCLKCGRPIASKGPLPRWFKPVVFLLVLLGLPLTGLAFSYGTLRPCEMALIESRRLMQDVLAERTGSTQNPLEALGIVLGQQLLSTAIEQQISTISPLGCAQIVFRAKWEGDQLRRDIAAMIPTATPTSVPKPTPTPIPPIVEYRGGNGPNFKFAGEGWKSSYGTSTYTGELKNIGDKVIHSAGLIISILDAKGNELGREGEQVVYPHQPPMLPGHVKPFRVSWPSIRGEKTIRVTIVSDQYED